MSANKSINGVSKFLLIFVVIYLFTGLVFAQQQETQTLSWMAEVESKLPPATWQKIPASVRMLIDAPKEFLELKSRVMEVTDIEAAEPVVGIVIKSKGGQEELESIGATVGSYIGDIFTVRIPIDKLGDLAGLDNVISIEPSMRLTPELDSSIVENKANLVHQADYSTTPPTYAGYAGKDVLVVAIDSGIDWHHGDFINDSDGTSRILYIWDQTLAMDSDENHPAGFSYGVEYSQVDINDEIDGSPTGYVRTEDDDGHGTHVMGIIAGDGSVTGGAIPTYTYVGMAPWADILVVKTGFYATQVIDGIDYAMQKADMFGKPVVINLSLGSQYGAHDGTSLFEQAIDNAVNTGKAIIVIAAGNDGTDAAHGEYIHAEGTVTTGSSHATTFEIPSYTPNSLDGTDFLEIFHWYQGGDNINVKVTTPTGYTWDANTGSNNNNQAISTYDGAIYIDNASGGTDPNNGDRMCYILIWDYYSYRPPKTGTWKITVKGNTITESGHYDSWIYFSQVGSEHVYYTAASGSNEEIIAYPGSAEQAITVAAHTTKDSWIDYWGTSHTLPDAVLYDLAYFSCAGPTRDDPGFITGRQKPDISASGFGVIAARSSDASWTSSSIYRNKDGVHILFFGTSMSAPHVTGAVALMLDKNPTLSAQQAKTILRNNARSDSYTGSVPNYLWGYGKLDIYAALQQIQLPPLAVDLFPSAHIKDGVAGDTVPFMFKVKNLGSATDNYQLTVSNNVWQTTIWDAAGTSQINITGQLASDAEFEFMVKVEIPSGATSSSRDFAIIRATSLTNSDIKNHATVVTRTPANLPWSDNFPTTVLDTIKWNFNGGPAEVNSVGLNEPSSPYSLNFNGDASGADEVQSQAIDLIGKSNVRLTYYYQRTGGGNSPETGDDFWVDYLNSSGIWVNLKQHLGSGSDMTTFQNEQVFLPTDAYHSLFKIRFRNVALPGPNDDWFLDDVALAEFVIDTTTVPFVETFPSTTFDPVKWPVNNGPAEINSIGLDEPSSPYSLNLDGEDEIESQFIDLSNESLVELSYYYQRTGGGNSTETGDDLFIEYLDASADWITLRQYLGSGSDMTAFAKDSIDLPMAAYHDGFRFRFRSTGDTGLDDWFVDDIKLAVKLPPDITITPDSFDESLTIGDSSLHNLTIGNVGLGDLNFNIATDYVSFGAFVNYPKSMENILNINQIFLQDENTADVTKNNNPTLSIGAFQIEEQKIIEENELDRSGHYTLNTNIQLKKIKSGDTIYVDVNNTSGIEDGSKQHPYSSIRAGVDNASGGEMINVKQGVYYEKNIDLNKSLTLSGNGAIIDGTPSTGSDKGFKVLGGASNVTITNFIITNCYWPIFVYSTSGGGTQIINNTLAYNDGTGIPVYNDCTLMNNIIAFNGGFGISYSGGNLLNSYNDIYGNYLDNWRNCSPGTGSISQDPLFADPKNNDFHLQVGSPCIDAGNPAPVFNDSDGSRNDMGAFGGPYIVMPTRGWLSITPTSGTVVPQGSQDVTVKFNPKDLTPDSTYHANLIITSNDPDEPIVRVPVKLNVIPPGIAIWAPDTSGSSNTTIDIPIYVQDVTKYDIFSVGVTATTKETVLKPVSATVSGTIAQGWGTPTTNISGGDINIAMAGTSPLIGDGKQVLVYIQYQTGNVPGDSTEIELSYVKFNEGEPSAIISHGKFKMITNFKIFGNVSYYNGNKPVPQTLISLTGHTSKDTTTDINGNYILTDIKGGDYKLTPNKSNDLGTSISPFDASMILRYSVGAITLNPYQKIAADVSGNGEVSPFDASYLLRFTVDLISQFPVGKDWTFVPRIFPIDDTNWFTAPDFYQYTPLNKDETGQDFLGIIYGDVSGNWLAVGSGTLAKTNFEAITIGTGEVIRVDEGILVPVFVDKPGVLSAVFKLKFNPSVLKATSVSTSELTPEYSIVSNIEDAQVRVALAGSIATDKPGHIVNIHFQILTDNQDAVSPLDFSEVFVNEGDMTIHVNSGEFSLKTLLPVEYAFSQNYPNPFNPETSIQYQLPVKGLVVMSIYNMLGQEVRSLIDAEKEAGYYDVIWDGKDNLGRPLPSGIYLVQLQVGKFVATKKMVMLK